MELKLETYKTENGKEVIDKTFYAEDFKLKYGTVTDFVEIIDFEQLKTGSDAEIVLLVWKAVVNGKDIINSLLKRIFTNLTDEDLRNTNIDAIVKVLVDLAKFTILEVMNGATGKN